MIRLNRFDFFRNRLFFGFELGQGFIQVGLCPPAFKMFNVQVRFNKQAVAMGLFDNLDDFFFLQPSQDVTAALQGHVEVATDMIQSGRGLLPVAEDPDGGDEKMGVFIQINLVILHESFNH